MLCHIIQLWTSEAAPPLTSLPHLPCESNGLHIASRGVTLDCCHSHICFLEQRRGSLQRAPSGVWGMCARIWGESFRQGLAGLVYFQRVVLRMCWEVEQSRELCALWFGFHLPGTQLGVWGREPGDELRKDFVFKQHHNKAGALEFLRGFAYVL